MGIPQLKWNDLAQTNGGILGRYCDPEQRNGDKARHAYKNGYNAVCYSRILYVK